MATQTGTLKAGNQLVIDSQGASVDYDVSVTCYAVDFKRIQQKNTLSLGPYKVDCTYSVTVNSGSPSVYKVQPNGQREYTANTLPDPATLAPGAKVVCGSALLVADSRPHLSLINGNPDQYHNGHTLREFPLKTTPFVVGGSGQYSSEPVLDSAGRQIGVKLICPASDASSNAWVDIVPPEGFGFLSDAGSITYLLGPSTGAHAQIIHTVGTDATFTTVTNYAAANSVRNAVDCEYPTALDADMYAGGLNLSNGAVCGAIRIKLRNNGTAAASSAIVYGVSLNKVARKGSIVLEFDDAFLSQYT